jgi:phospholipase/carboxylesterase
MALSTYVPIPGDVAASPGNCELPVFMGHGTFDPMVLHSWGRASADRLKAAGFEVEWHDYPMQHAVCAEEIQDIRAWLLGVLTPRKDLSS